MNIRQMLVSPSKYNIKCPYAMTPKYITIHNTANDASANNEVSYMINNNYEVSFHYAVDDKEAVQAIPENRCAWHAGDGGSGTGNRYSIGIEICYSKSGGNRFIQAEKNAAYLTATLLKKYGWGIDRVKRHYDWSNKYCPHRTMDMGWQRFLNMVQTELNGFSSKPSTGNVSTNLKPSGTFLFTDICSVYNKPDFSQAPVVAYYKGETVNYDRVLTGTYVWLGYTSYDGKQRFVCVGKKGAIKGRNV